MSYGRGVTSNMARMLFAILFATAALAQPVRPAFTEFEVAAVKPAEPNAVGRWIRMQTVHQFVAHNSTLLYLIAPAYNISPHAISGGPSWVDADRFEITAKAPGTTVRTRSGYYATPDAKPAPAPEPK